MNELIKDLLQNTYNDIAEVLFENGLLIEEIINNIKDEQNIMMRNAFERAFSKAMDKIFPSQIKFIQEQSESIEPYSNETFDFDKHTTLCNDITIEETTRLNADVDNSEVDNSEDIKCRWPETSPTALKYKSLMQELLDAFNKDPYDPWLPNTKEQIIEYCNIKSGTVNDFRNWLKKYHHDFYYIFISDFPGFGGRND